MEFWDIVNNRHSTRDFRPDPVERPTVEKLIAAARTAPSAANSQPWHFTVVQGETRLRLGQVVAQSTVHLSEYMDVLGPKRYEAAMHWYSSLGDAPVLIALSAPRADSEFTALNRNLSLGAAIENLLLAAAEEGLGACNITFGYWVKDEMAELLRIPDIDEVVTVMAVGFPSDVPPASPPRTEDDTVWLG